MFQISCKYEQNGKTVKGKHTNWPEKDVKAPGQWRGQETHSALTSTVENPCCEADPSIPSKNIIFMIRFPVSKDSSCQKSRRWNKVLTVGIHNTITFLQKNKSPKLAISSKFCDTFNQGGIYSRQIKFCVASAIYLHFLKNATAQWTSSKCWDSITLFQWLYKSNGLVFARSL